MNSDFLDKRQYTPENILDYELVWGQGFVSPGGMAKARDLIVDLDVHRGGRVLDVGCGLGGSAFLMAEEFGLLVDAIDLSQNMVSRAQEGCSQKGLERRVTVRRADCLKLCATALYDAVYSRDVFLHVADKPLLFEVLHRALRPGGKLLFTDYCCAAKPWSPSFSDYVTDRSYHLRTVDEYSALLRAAGFRQVTGQDLTQQFVATLQADLQRISELPGRAALRDAWQAKLTRAEAGEQRWGCFTALKP
jgi:phosphoethanolamine N-methyltransferase